MVLSTHSGTATALSPSATNSNHKLGDPCGIDYVPGTHPLGCGDGDSGVPKGTLDSMGRSGLSLDGLIEKHSHRRDHKMPKTTGGGLRVQEAS